jgi:hypothetical protein
LRDWFVSLASPDAYCVSDKAGDFDGSAEWGLFYWDVRHISELRLRVGGRVGLAGSVGAGLGGRVCDCRRGGA